MATEQEQQQTSCDPCDQIAIKAEFDALAAAVAAERDLDQLGVKHEIAADEADAAALVALEKATWDNEYELNTLFHTTIATVAQGSVDRARDSAKFVQASATAIAAAYAAILGLVYSVTSNALPIRGIWATVFLGLAAALATGYLAFITRSRNPEMYSGGASLSEMQINRTAYLVRWVNTTVRNRSWALRASVISLAFGVVFIAAPFISSAHPAAIPDAPSAPAIPAAIANPVAAEATKLFTDQVNSYEAANAARNQAITVASKASSSAAAHEDMLNRRTTWLALIGVLLVLLGPFLYEALSRAKKNVGVDELLPPLTMIMKP